MISVESYTCKELDAAREVIVWMPPTQGSTLLVDYCYHLTAFLVQEGLSATYKPNPAPNQYIEVVNGGQKVGVVVGHYSITTHDWFSLASGDGGTYWARSWASHKTARDLLHHLQSVTARYELWLQCTCCHYSSKGGRARLYCGLGMEMILDCSQRLEV